MTTPDRPVGVVFGQCEDCPFKNDADAARCYSCFREVVPPMPPRGTCPICGQVKPGVKCRNFLCNARDRNFAWNRSLGYLDKDGPYYQVVVRNYKYRDRESKWGLILARILAGYLQEQAHIFADFDHFIPNPIYVSSDGRRHWDPVAFVLTSAATLLVTME